MAAGSFFSGLAGGFAGGARLGLDIAEGKERQQDRAMARENMGLEMDERRRKLAEEAERRNFLQGLTHEPVESMDEAGNPMRSMRPKKDVDLRKVATKLYEYDASKGRITPEQIVKFQQLTKSLDDEGLLEVAGSDDPEEIKEHFAKKGKLRLAPGSEPMQVELNDNQFGRRKAWRARLVDASGKDIGWGTLDPMAIAYAQLGAKERVKFDLDRRTADAAQRRLDVTEARNDQRHQETLAALDLRRDHGDRRLAIDKQRADAYGERVRTAFSGGRGRASVFEQKRLAWLARHPDDEDGALDYASGRKTLGDTDLRLAAERLANSLKDPRTGQPLDARAKKVAADDIFVRLTATRKGAEPAAPNNDPLGLRK